MAITIDTGISEYLDYGTGATADTYVGRVISGELRADNNRVWRSSIGGKHAPGRGIWNGGGRATIEVANVTLLNYARRASYTSPSLTSLTFEGGCRTASTGFTQTGCKIASLDLECSVGDALQATIEWVATDQAKQASPSPQSASATHWEWFHGECTVYGQTYHAQRMRISLANNLTAVSSLDNKSTNLLVLPEDFIVGNEEVDFSVELLEYPGTGSDFLWMLHEDTDVTGVTALMQFSDGTNTWTATLANLAGSAVRMPLQGDDGAVIWALDMQATRNESNSLSLSYSP